MGPALSPAPQAPVARTSSAAPSCVQGLRSLAQGALPPARWLQKAGPALGGRETRFCARETRFCAREPGFRARETRFRARETRFRARETRFRGRETWFRARETRFR